MYHGFFWPRKPRKPSKPKHVMKLCLLLVALFTFNLSASSTNQATKISITKSNVSIKSVFEEITSTYGYRFFYNTEFDVNRKVSINVKNGSMELVMNQILANIPYSHSIIDNQIVIKKDESKVKEKKTPTQQPTQQSKEPFIITGVIKDTEGQALPGASIHIKGTNVGTAAIEGGRYTFKFLPAEKIILVFSFIGKQTKEIPFSNQTVLDVTLEDDISNIDDVVVTGIFTKARESYTGAVTSISADQLGQFKGQNLVTTLRNIDPAINIITNNLTGSDPNSIPDITIRGSSSLPIDVQEFNESQKYNINAPLIIMDGFEIRLEKLLDYNDEEIESINILKDASATAIYGSRGANGVIVIISKQPEPGKLRINFRAGIELEIPDLTSYNLMNAKEKLQLEWDNGFYNNLNPDTDYGLKRKYNEIYRNVLEGTDTYWLSKPLRTGVTQRYNLRLEGGSNEFRWGVAAAYNRIAGVMKESNRDNFSGEITLSYHYRNVIFRNQTNIGINKAVNSKYGSFSDYANMNPYWKTHDNEGKLISRYSAVTGDINGYSQNVNNPLYNASLNSINESAYTDLINNFSIEWNIFEGLILRGQLGISKQFNKSDIFTPPGNTKYLEAPYTSGDGVLRKGEYLYGNGENLSYDGNITLNYSKTFQEKHQLYFGLDYSISERKDFSHQFLAEGFTNENLNSIGSAMRYAQNGSPTESENHTRRVGFTGNINYTFDNRYYIDASIRADGSSQFGNNNRFAPFWSAGLGWNIHREKFLLNNNLIDNLRLKISYGQTGSQQFSAYQALSTFAYYMDDRYGNWGGAYLKSHGNNDLKWQVTDQFNVGVELGIFRNRLTASFDYYTKKTSNLLSKLDIPLATGFSSYIANVGEVQNTGFETALGGYIIRDTERNFIWTVNAKLAYNKNKITKISDDIKAQNELYIKQDVDVSTLFYEGYSQNALYVVRSLGIDPSTGKEVFLDKKGNVTETWKPSDKVYAGVNEPTYRGNFSTMFRYKNLSLNLSFGYHWGGVAYNQTLINKVEMLRTSIGRNNVDKRVLNDRWNKPGDYAEFKKIPAMEETDIATRATSRFIMKDKAFELQSASLQYRLENKWLMNNGVSSATFTINASDLFYISTIKRERGINYPFARRIGGSITLMF